MQAPRHQLMEDLIRVVDKYTDSLGYEDISEELISYGTRMMMSVSVNDVNGFKNILSNVAHGLDFYRTYHS